MKAKLFSILLLTVILTSLVLSSCSNPKVKQVGKVFDSYKQISGNLYYDTLSENNDVYEINYDAVGNRECKLYKKNGYNYVYDIKSNEVCIVGDIVVLPSDVEITTTTTITTTTVTTTTEAKTTKKKRNKKPKTTKPKTPKTTTYRYIPPKTEKPTTKPKVFIFDGEKYYIDENGNWIKA